MRSNVRPRRLIRLTMTGVAAATLALAGCSNGGDWPTAGAPSASATTPVAAPVPDVPTADAGPSRAAGAQDDQGGTEPSGSGAQPGPGVPGPGGGDAPRRCTTAELAGSLGPGDGAAGSVNQTLILTNTGSRTCTLRGFPGLSYVGGDDGGQVGPAATMSGPRGADVRLAPGGSAGAEMRLANVGNFDPEQCRPVPVRGLRVYPPGDTASLFVPRDGRGCSATPTGGDQLSIRTLTAR